MSQFLKPAILIALYALLLPVVGPLLDHHYVEWQHNHSHVYFGGGPEDAVFHVHIYDVTAAHDHLPVTDYSNGRGAPEGVAYFSGYDGAGNGPISSPTAPLTLSLIFPDPNDQPLLAAYSNAELAPAGVRVAPPRKPPAA